MEVDELHKLISDYFTRFNVNAVLIIGPGGPVLASKPAIYTPKEFKSSDVVSAACRAAGSKHYEVVPIEENIVRVKIF